MTEPESLLLLAAALPAPFAFRLGAVVRDGREFGVGLLFLALSSGTAALTCFLSDSLLLAVPAPDTGPLPMRSRPEMTFLGDLLEGADRVGWRCGCGGTARCGRRNGCRRRRPA